MANYAQNLGKEVKQFGTAWAKAWQASGQVGPGTDARANRLRKKQDEAMGQLFGAALQGRRYNDKTGRQVKAADANTPRRITRVPAMPGNGPITKIAKKAAAKKKSM